MRVFGTKWFGRFARKEGIGNQALLEAIQRAEEGKIDADLGGNIIKQRVARKGQGRSSGYRMLIAFRTKTRAIFVYGFPKSNRENISTDELDDLKDLAQALLTFDDGEIAELIKNGKLQEVLP